MESWRNYSPWLSDTGLGNLCVSNWDMAVSSQAATFDLTINCCHYDAVMRGLNTSVYYESCTIINACTYHRFSTYSDKKGSSIILY